MPFLFGILLGIGLFFLASSRVKIEHQKAAKFGEFSFPRAGYGSPAPIVWGRFRQDSPIVIDYGAFRSEPITQKIKTGLFGSEKQTIAHRYYFNIAMLVALGPGVRLRKIWANNNKLVWEGNLAGGGEVLIDKPGLFGGEKEGGGLKGKLRFYSGAFDQPQDPALVAMRGANVPAYVGSAYVVLEDFYIGTSTTPPTFHFEIERIPAVVDETTVNATMPGGADFNPVSAVLDALTKRWGGFGTPPSAFDLTAFARDALTVRNEAANKTRGFSQIAQQVMSADDLVSEMLQHVDGILYDDPATGLITTRLIRFDYDIDSIPVLDDSTIVSIADYSKSTWDTTVNTVRVTYRDRASDYNESVASTPDFALINSQRRVRSSDKSMPSVTSAEGAQYLSARDLGYSNVPLISCTINANRSAFGLRPGDVIRVRSTKGIVMTDIVFRVLKVNLGTTKDGTISLKCVQDRFSSHIGSFAPPSKTDFVPPDTDARNIVAYRAFTAPFFVANAGEQASAYETTGKIMFVAEKPGPGSQTFDIRQSYGSVGVSSEIIGNDISYSAIGSLASAYSAAEAFSNRVDTTRNLRVTGLSSYERALIAPSSTLDDVRDGSALMLIGDELFAYVNPTIESNGDVTFGSLYRAVLDTAPQSHNAGASVSFIFGKTGLTGGVEVGRTSNLKVTDRTATQEYPLASAPTIAVPVSDRASRPLPPADVRVNGSRTPSNAVNTADITVAWKNRSRLDGLLRAYTEAGVAYEPGVKVRIRWSVGGGPVQTAYATGSSHTIPAPGGVGTITITVDAYNENTLKASLANEQFAFALTAP